MIDDNKTAVRGKSHLKTMLPTPISAIKHTVWPAPTGIQQSSLLASLLQLEFSQWWSLEQTLSLQKQQLSNLLLHAAATTDYYGQEYFSAADITPGQIFSWKEWRRLPILERHQIQKCSNKLTSHRPPKHHGAISSVFSSTSTSGSTDKPLNVLVSGLNKLLWQTLELREHAWHRRDLSGKLAAIKPVCKQPPGEAETLPGWGSATDNIYSTGPCVMMNIRTDIETQALWLIRENPEYLLSLPSNLLALVRWFGDNNQNLPALKEVRAYDERTYGESVSNELIELCQQIWQTPLTGAYSSQELGAIALQCPETGLYHIQAENVLVEILDEKGEPCEAGQTGRVVVTNLQNYAMPLIRYAIGDFAETGEPCSCGRGLPTIKKC